MITIGITTYNRLTTLKRMAKSFYASELSYPYAIRIYDDCSSEFDVAELRAIFPNAVSIFRQPQNLGADGNTWYMYQDFLKSSDSIFFNADSDLIFSKHWMENGIKLLEKSDGVLSIFNASSHPPISLKEDICEKEDIGAAGTFFRRELLLKLTENKTILEKRLNTEGIDYQWCRYFRSIGCRIYASIQSYVQHIGFDGYNSSMEDFDFGTGFSVDSLLNGQIINDTMEESFCQKSAGKKKYALFPFEKIPKDAKVVLYGAGATGQDYIAQIQNSGYCKLVAVIDKQFASMQNVLPPQKLLELHFDYIVLAALRKDFIDEMIIELSRLSSSFSDKIIYRNDAQAIRV